MTPRERKYDGQEDRPWPPPGTYWVTRDSCLNGELEDVVDVWLAPPMRFTVTGYERAGYWLSEDWSLETRYGRYTYRSFLAWQGVAPDTDRECLKVG